MLKDWGLFKKLVEALNPENLKDLLKIKFNDDVTPMGLLERVKSNEEGKGFLESVVSKLKDDKISVEDLKSLGSFDSLVALLGHLKEKEKKSISEQLDVFDEDKVIDDSANVRWYEVDAALVILPGKLGCSLFLRAYTELRLDYSLSKAGRQRGIYCRAIGFQRWDVIRNSVNW